MKEAALLAVVLIALLFSACNRIKKAEVKSKELPAMAKPTSKKSQMKEDYYYSAQSAALWHEMNKRMLMRMPMRINKVNGIAYTERVPHGAKPTCKVTDAVLVASGVEGYGLTVEYTNVAW